MTNKTCVMGSPQLIYRKKKSNGMFKLGNLTVIAYLKIHYSHFPFRMFSIECDFFMSFDKNDLNFLLSKVNLEEKLHRCKLSLIISF